MGRRPGDFQTRSGMYLVHSLEIVDTLTGTFSATFLIEQPSSRSERMARWISGLIDFMVGTG